MFSCFRNTPIEDFETRLLTISIVRNETQLDTDEHFQLSSFIPRVYGKTWSDMICLIGANANMSMLTFGRTKIRFQNETDTFNFAALCFRRKVDTKFKEPES